MLMVNEVYKSFSSAIPTTVTTSLSMVRRAGTNNVALYAHNEATCTVYGLFKGCHTNTANTSYWYTVGATATIPASSTTGINSYSVSALQAQCGYLTFEHAATATGGVSALTLELSVW